MAAPPPPTPEPAPPYVHPVPGMSPYEAVAPPGVEAPRATPRTHPLAVVGLLAGLAFCVPGSSLAALVMGALALRDTRRAPERFGGGAIAVAALVVGGVGLSATIVAWIAFALRATGAHHAAPFAP